MTIATQNIEAANLGGLDLSCPYCGDTSLTTPSGRVFDIASDDAYDEVCCSNGHQTDAGSCLISPSNNRGENTYVVPCFDHMAENYICLEALARSSAAAIEIISKQIQADPRLDQHIEAGNVAIRGTTFAPDDTSEITQWRVVACRAMGYSAGAAGIKPSGGIGDRGLAQYAIWPLLKDAQEKFLDARESLTGQRAPLAHASLRHHPHPIDNIPLPPELEKKEKPHTEESRLE